jgi:hypothetical protein
MVTILVVGFGHGSGVIAGGHLHADAALQGWGLRDGHQHCGCG